MTVNLEQEQMHKTRIIIVMEINSQILIDCHVFADAHTLVYKQWAMRVIDSSNRTWSLLNNWRTEFMQFFFSFFSFFYCFVSRAPFRFHLTTQHNSTNWLQNERRKKISATFARSRAVVVVVAAARRERTTEKTSHRVIVLSWDDFIGQMSENKFFKW